VNVSSEPQNIEDVRVDTNNLYREEIFTDLKVGTIRRLTPVTAEGTMDPSRPARFIAQTQIMSNMGPLPVQGDIQATTMQEAIEKFPEAIKLAVDQLMEDARELQRREMSRIVTPDAGTASKILTGK
jgi:hypothetical protein